MIVWLYFVLASFFAALIHELGHVCVVLLQGHREPVIRFGSPRDKLLASIRCGPIRIQFHVGARLLLTPPHYLFSARFADSALNRLLRAAAGPAASALLYLLAAPGVKQGIRDLLHFSFVTDSFPSALAFWGALGALVPLFPMRYRSIGINSDGLTIARSLKQLLPERSRA